MTTDARRAGIPLGSMSPEMFTGELAKYGFGYGSKSQALVSEAVRRLRLDAEAEARGIAKGLEMAAVDADRRSREHHGELWIAVAAWLRALQKKGG